MVAMLSKMNCVHHQAGVCLFVATWGKLIDVFLLWNTEYVLPISDKFFPLFLVGLHQQLGEEAEELHFVTVYSQEALSVSRDCCRLDNTPTYTFATLLPG